MTYTDEEQDTLRALVEMVVPASTRYNIPGAGDETILKDILGLATPHHAIISKALAALEVLAQDVGGANFANLRDSDRSTICETFRTTQPEVAGLIAALTVQCYYRDERVMHSLDMEARPPFPQGFEVDQGDWSLLEPVRKRKPFFREI